MTDPKLEYLESIHSKNAATQKVIEGAAMVQAGGIEGIVEVANTHPEVILEAFQALSLVINLLQEDNTQLVEDYFETLDKLEKIINDPS